MLACLSVQAHAAEEENFIFGVSGEHARDTVVCGMEAMTGMFERVNARAGEPLQASDLRDLSTPVVEHFRACVEKAHVPLPPRNIDDCFLQSVYLPDEAQLVGRGLVSREVWEAFWTVRMRDGDELGDASRGWFQSQLDRLAEATPKREDAGRSVSLGSLKVIQCARFGGPMVRFDLKAG